MGFYNGKGKDKSGKATYYGGAWHGPNGNRVKGPKRAWGDKDERYVYESSKAKVRKRY